MCYCIFLMYCIISNSSAHVATAVLPECFETLGECTHYTNLKLKKKKIEYLKKIWYFTTISFRIKKCTT